MLYCAFCTLWGICILCIALALLAATSFSVLVTNNLVASELLPLKLIELNFFLLAFQALSASCISSTEVAKS